MSLTWLGTGKGGGLEYTTSLPGTVLQSLCPLGDQHSWRTTLHYCFSHKNQDMQVELWQNRELTSWWDSLWKRGADSLIRTYLVSVIFSLPCEFLTLVLQHPIFCLELWWNLKHQWQMKTHTAEAGTNVLMLLGNEEHQEVKHNCHCWLLKYGTQVLSWLWQQRSLHSEAVAVTSTVSLPALFSGVT